MEGYIVEYKPSDDRNRVNLNHTLYGRIVYRNYRGKKYIYYSPGMLDAVKFYRLTPGKIFVVEEIDIECLKEFGDVKIFKDIRDEKRMVLMTAEEYWNNTAVEKNMQIRKGGKK